MKRLFAIVVALFAVCSGYAQEIGNNALLESQIAYDEAVLSYKQAVTEMRNEERRVADVASQRVAERKLELQSAKQNLKATIAEHKQRVADAKRQLKNASVRYKEECERAKQEISASKSNTKSVVAERKSQVATAKAEIARVRSEVHAK
jgi:uncharacterized protein (DUF342 family)